MPDAKAKVLSINRTPGDFVRDTQHLTALEIGVYNQICDNIVILGQDDEPPSLPDDDSFIASIVKLSKVSWKKMKPRLCSGQLAVLVLEDGRISQARVVEEIDAARVRIAGASKAGLASGDARRRKAAVLRERMTNGRSNGGSTSVAVPFDASSLGQSNAARTSHESRVTSNEEPKTESKALSSPSAPVTTPRTSAKAMVEGWQPEDQHRIWAAQNCPSVPVDEETEAWKDRLRANGYLAGRTPVKDPAASWRTSMKNAEKWGTYVKRGNGNGSHRGSEVSTGAREVTSPPRNPLGDFGMRDGRDVVRELEAKRALSEVPKSTT